MDRHSMPAAVLPNPALNSFEILVGKWRTTGTHGLMPGVELHGSGSYEWLEGGAFLVMRSQLDDERFPVTVAVFASDDSEKQCYMLTFDSRGVSRKHDVSFDGRVLKWWRDAPGFRQRYEAIVSEDGNSIVSRGELSRDGVTWEKDLELTYTRVGA